MILPFILPNLQVRNSPMTKDGAKTLGIAAQPAQQIYRCANAENFDKA
jgi:hypothetical protein